MTNRADILEALADKLQRFIDMPEWQRFYMDKDQAADCAACLRAHASIERTKNNG